MKAQQILFLCAIVGLCGLAVRGQACGYSFNTFFVTDRQGRPVTDAKIELFSQNSADDAYLAGEATTLRWDIEKGAFVLVHGMCSGHRGVGLRISAAGFEPFERVIDLPLNTRECGQVLVVKLRQKRAAAPAEFEQLFCLRGRVADETEAAIAGTKVILTDKRGRRTITVTDEYGDYRLTNVAGGQYTIEFVGPAGFAPVKYENVEVSAAHSYLRVRLKVDPNCCLATEIVCRQKTAGKDGWDCVLVTRRPDRENKKQ